VVGSCQGIGQGRRSRVANANHPQFSKELTHAVAAEKKSFLLRVDPMLWSQLERLAASELRSVNAQVEFLLRDALQKRGLKMEPTDHS
jgi:hypothetical protein